MDISYKNNYSCCVVVVCNKMFNQNVDSSINHLVTLDSSVVERNVQKINQSTASKKN